MKFICTKTQYASEKDANSDMERIRKKSNRSTVPIRSYLCKFCSSWHLTSHEDFTEKIKALTKEIESLKRESDSMKAENKNLKVTNGELKVINNNFKNKAITEESAKAKKLGKTIEQLNQQIHAMKKSNIEQLNQQIQTLKKSNKELIDRLFQLEKNKKIE